MMSQSRTIKREAEGAKELLDGGILIALGLSIFVLSEWHAASVRSAVMLAWCAILLSTKGPELVRIIRRTE